MYVLRTHESVSPETIEYGTVEYNPVGKWHLRFLPNETMLLGLLVRILTVVTHPLSCLLIVSSRVVSAENHLSW